MRAKAINGHKSPLVSHAGIQESTSALGALGRLQPGLARVDRDELSEAVAPVIAQLGEPLVATERLVVAEAVFAFCRSLHRVGRSLEALPLARAVLAQSIVTGDRALELRASGYSGLLAADTADLVAAFAHFARTATLAQEAGDVPQLAYTWGNIGLAFAVGFNYDLAIRAYRRGVRFAEGVPDLLHARVTGLCNLANGHYQVGQFEEGLRCGEEAMRAGPEVLESIGGNFAFLLRRNLVRLLVALDRTAQARPIVDELAARAAVADTPRAHIAAATARATYEVATGQSDIALTRLDEALAMARGVPGALRDTLATIVRVEEAAGNPERALLRLQELSDLAYRHAVERAREHLAFASLFDSPAAGPELVRERTRARLQAGLGRPAAPENWASLQRLSVTATMRLDDTGMHGARVGALVKSLALASGRPPLDALEMGLAAELHDIGMASLPEAVFEGRGLLGEAGRALAERHTDAGAEILRGESHPRLLLAHDIAAYHHARWDGAGHPPRVDRDRIPFAARACAVADAYDAMVCGLEGESRRSMQVALAEIRRGAGTRFDPALASAFETMIREESEDLGLDTASPAGLEAFQSLVESLQQDKGFL